MKVQELRIGNLVCPDDISVVTAIRNNGFIDIETITSPEDDYCTKVIEDISAIPLIEEWLIKFGFNRQENSKTLFIQVGNGLYIENEDGEISITPATWRGTTVTPLAEIKYVHQLQNLFFALTGEELTIKA